MSVVLLRNSCWPFCPENFYCLSQTMYSIQFFSRCRVPSHPSIKNVPKYSIALIWLYHWLGIYGSTLVHATQAAAANRKYTFSDAIYLDRGNWKIFFGLKLFTFYTTPCSTSTVERVCNSEFWKSGRRAYSALNLGLSFISLT